ncbi:MAG: hypothetical protein NVS3B18_05320 [Candidatus Dormibacteria bacterium]
MSDQAPEPVITVLICDDHAAVRRGLAEVLSAAPDIDVIAAAENGEEAVEFVTSYHPAVVLMDVSMPGMDGMEATRQLLAARPQTRVIMLTSYSGHEREMEALGAGAVGYLLKDSTPEEVIQGIRIAVSAPVPPEA